MACSQAITVCQSVFLDFEIERAITTSGRIASRYALFDFRARKPHSRALLLQLWRVRNAGDRIFELNSFYFHLRPRALRATSWRVSSYLQAHSFRTIAGALFPFPVPLWIFIPFRRVPEIKSSVSVRRHATLQQIGLSFITAVSALTRGQIMLRSRLRKRILWPLTLYTTISLSSS